MLAKGEKLHHMAYTFPVSLKGLLSKTLGNIRVSSFSYSFRAKFRLLHLQPCRLRDWEGVYVESGMPGVSMSMHGKTRHDAAKCPEEAYLLVGPVASFQKSLACASANLGTELCINFWAGGHGCLLDGSSMLSPGAAGII